MVGAESERLWGSHCPPGPRHGHDVDISSARRSNCVHGPYPTFPLVKTSSVLALIFDKDACSSDNDLEKRPQLRCANFDQTSGTLHGIIHQALNDRIVVRTVQSGEHSMPTKSKTRILVRQ